MIWNKICTKSILAIATVLCLAVIFSFRQPRAWLSRPLYVHDPDARAAIAYVMSGGPASFERLLAASDLYHTERISSIALENDTQPSCYNYLKNKSESRSDRCIAYLMMRGVPEDRIKLVPKCSSSRFGSLREAQSVAKDLGRIENLIVITSPTHTRRTELAFIRSLPKNIKVHIYAASDLAGSDEIFSPIWIEYLKLAAYFFIA